MPSSYTELQTDQAKRYMSLVSKHWSHRFAVSNESENRSTIDFGDSSCTIHARDGSLAIEVFGPESSLRILEETVLDHLQRFAPKEVVLKTDWFHRA